MSPVSYTLLVGAISIVVGILICLAVLNALGQLHLGDLFRRRKGENQGGNQFGISMLAGYEKSIT
jgi:hypothetical protein